MASRLTLSDAMLGQLGLRFPRGPTQTLHCLPAVRGSMEFALAVRSTFRRLQPAAIVIDFPVALERSITRAIRQMPVAAVVSWNDATHHELPCYLVLEPTDPRVEAARIALEHDLPLLFCGSDPPARQQRFAGPDPWTATHVGMHRYLEIALAAIPPRTAADAAAALIHATTRASSQVDGDVLVVCELGLARTAIDVLSRPDDVQALCGRKPSGHAAHRLAPASLRELHQELPWLQGRYEQARRQDERAHHPLAQPPGETLDRAVSWRELLHESLSWVGDDTAIGLSARMRDAIAYACRLARVQGRITPRLYELVVAARGFFDDEVADALWMLATDDPWCDRETDLESLEITPADLGLSVQTIALSSTTVAQGGARPPHLQVVQASCSALDDFTSPDVCSFPPEDRRMSETLRRMTDEQRARARVAAATHACMPVAAEGRTEIDAIERRFGEPPGAYAPAIVVCIYDDELLEQTTARRGAPRYPWHVSWQAEDDEEGDLVFFASHPDTVRVQPGIARPRYGGFVWVPHDTLRAHHGRRRGASRPFGPSDAWAKPSPNVATKGELLLLHALSLRREGSVIHVAARPPSQRICGFARTFAGDLVHVPLYRAPRLAALRDFHVLTHPSLRVRLQHSPSSMLSQPSAGAPDDPAPPPSSRLHIAR